jgi:hypothetical protein
MIDISGSKKRFAVLSGLLDERSRRMMAAAESSALGRGGFPRPRATRVSRSVICQGVGEFENRQAVVRGRVRRLAEELQRQRHAIGYPVAAERLGEHG